MGITAARPYIIDEFESEDEAAYETAVECMADSLLLNTVNAGNERNGPLSTEQQQFVEDPVVVQQTKEVQVSNSSTINRLKGLEELLKLLESHDFEGAQKAACLLKQNPAFYSSDAGSAAQEEDKIASQSVKSTESYTVTSTWSTNTEEDITEVASCSFQLPTDLTEDLTEDQRKVLAQLDEELNQFEANEEKIASEPNIFHSGIPRLMSSARSSGTLTDASRKTPDRKRSPSPSGRLKASGIPRYSWAHVSPVTGSPCSPAESKTEHTLDASCLSDTLQSLPELSDRIQAHRKTWDKNVGVDKTTSISGHSHISLANGQSGDSPAPGINMCDHSGRVRMRKRHFCLPASWTKPEEFPRVQSKRGCSPSISNSSSSQMATEEILACKTIGECGDPSKRKVLDLKRWYCISRPQYRSSCGISSVVSCWNYLFSTLGHGRLKPVTQEVAMKLFGFTSPFDEISFGPITGNLTLLRWFSELCSHFNVSGQGFIMYKPSGTNQTEGVTDEMALDFLKKGLNDTNTAFIYHCHNHYFCPIGYEDTPQFCVDAYGGDVGNGAECWVLIGDTSRKYPAVHCISWDHICQDLNCKAPNYINIRQSWKGIMQQKNLKTCGCSENLHCILAFQTVHDDAVSSTNSLSSSSNASSLTKSLCLPPNSPSTQDAPTMNLLSKVNAHRPELGNDNLVDYPEDEVGSEKLETDKSDDERVDESEVKKSEVKENEVYESEVKENEVKENEVKESEVEENEVEEREVKENEVKESEVKENEVEESEVKESEVKESEVKESEVKESEMEETDVKESEVKESDVQESEVKESDVKESDVEESEVKESDVQESEVKESEVQESEVQESEVQESEVQESDVQESEVKESEVKENEVKESEVK